MINDEFEYENPSDLEDILYSMNSEDFLTNELDEQLNDGIFNENKTNYLESYMSKYKFYKSEYESNIEFLESLKDKKDHVIEYVLNQISEKFNITIDDESRTTKVAKVLYEFFVIDYKENLQTMIFNYINGNKKTIIPEIKRHKKGKDVSTSASKLKYNNCNDALIINNMQHILFEIIPNSINEDFLDLIVNTDDSVANLAIQDFIEKNKIMVDIDTFNSFIGPLIEEEDGWSDVLSEIVIQLTQNANLAEIDIFEE